MSSFRRAIGEVLLASKAGIISPNEVEDLLQSLLESERSHHAARAVLLASERNVANEYRDSTADQIALNELLYGEARPTAKRRQRQRVFA
jgi:hypothetical protein